MGDRENLTAELSYDVRQITPNKKSPPLPLSLSPPHSFLGLFNRT